MQKKGPSKAAAGEDAAGLKRARRLNQLLDQLSASIGRAYGQLLRQPSMEKKQNLQEIEEEVASVSGLVTPEVPVPVADFKLWKSKVKELSHQCGISLPTIEEKEDHR